MEPRSAIDGVNMATMRSAKTVAEYAHYEDLYAHERLIVDRIAREAKGKPILDLGVGTGRTTRGLLALSEDYVGVDYSLPMIESCRRRFPAVRFEVGDARDLSAFGDASFFFVMFSCNGLCMVGQEDRLAILREVRRVLMPGGAFFFSTHNQNSPEHDARFKFPEFGSRSGPLQLARSCISFAYRAALSLRNRRKNRPMERRGSDYSIINDKFHHYGTLLYYISLERQREQLVACGFQPNAEAWDDQGRAIVSDTKAPEFGVLAHAGPG